MEWGSWSSFWAMGGYWPFVWGSYGATVIVLIAETWALRRRRAQALAEVARQRTAAGGAARSFDGSGT